MNNTFPLFFRIILMIVCFSGHLNVNAQVVAPPDVATVEAYINDHKQQRSLLLARATLEESNALLHKASKVTNRDYKDINDQLDRYIRAFDIIDLVYSTVSTGFNVYNTYNDVTDKISKYKKMLNDYHEVILKRLRVEPADTLLLFVNGRAIASIAAECQNLYTTLTVIAGYATSQTCCTTSTLMAMVESIDASLTRIRNIINSAYNQTWKFIQVRTRLWKSELYRNHTVSQIGNDALGRWRASSINALDKNKLKTQNSNK